METRTVYRVRITNGTRRAWVCTTAPDGTFIPRALFTVVPAQVAR